MGVFKRPEDIGFSVEYLNPSFMVKKPSGATCPVTAFAHVGRYSKPQPSLMSNIDSTLRHIAQWKYINKSDLTSAFYQIPLSRDSMKYCGVATPFKGVRVYVPSTMGAPGSKTALEELMCHVLGHLLEEGRSSRLLMTSTVEPTVNKNFSTTGKKSFRPFTTATFVCQRQNLSSTPPPRPY